MNRKAPKTRINYHFFNPFQMVVVGFLTVGFFLWLLLDPIVDEDWIMYNVLFPIITPFYLLYCLLCVLIRYVSNFLDLLLVTGFLFVELILCVAQSILFKAQRFDDWLDQKSDGNPFV